MRLLATFCVFFITVPTLAGDRRPDPQRLVVMTFNAKFLWDGEGIEEAEFDFPGKGNRAHARKHMAAIAEVIARSNPDIVNLVEVENLAALTTFNRDFLADQGYRPYLIEGKDTYTGQDVCLLTRVDPIGPLGREDREGRSGDTRKGVSKNYFAKFQIGGLKFALIGIHFLARPDKTDRRPSREAQADAIHSLARDLDREGYEIVILGDVNDYDDGEGSRDHLDSRPISNVLTILKSMGPGPDDDLINAASHIPKAQRYTSHYDRNKNKKIDKDELTSIDHILLSPRLNQMVSTAKIDDQLDTFKVTDHFPVVVTLQLNQP